MTLHADRPPEVQLTDTTTLPIVMRPGRRPRLAFWYWLRHPRRARWITLLIREAFRWRDQAKPDLAALTWAEAAVLREAQHALRDRVDTTVKRIDDLADRFHALQLKAERERSSAQRERTIVVKTGVNLYAAGPLTGEEAQKVVEKCRKRIEEDSDRGQTRHLDRPAKGWWSWLALVPLFVDIIALVTVITKFFNINSLEQAWKKPPDTITAVAFAVIASFVLAVLAHSAGTDAWQVRAVSRGQPARENGTEEEQSEARPSDSATSRTGEFPESRFVLWIKLGGMGVVSALVAVSIATRVIQPTPDKSTSALGWMIGLTLGVAAFLAPWVLVYMRMKAGSLETQTVDELTGAMREMEATITGHEKAANESADEAATVRAEADRAQRGGLQSAMNLADTTREVIDLARSHHGQAGQLAINDNVRMESRYVAIREMLATSTDAIEQAMKRFGSSGDAQHS